MDIAALYQIYLKHRLICTDTRKIERNCMFFALKGAKFNGNDFATEALEKGAGIAVVDDPKLAFDSRLIRVPDVLSTLQQLSALHRKKSGFKILAVTGSNGKTTTKELCRAVLSRRYKVRATEGNFNNHIGVPLTLLSMDPGTEWGIVEMGANHPGEIRSLCEIAQPDYGLITNIGKAHLEGFGNVENVLRAKGELFSYLVKHGKTLFVNEGDPYVKRLIPDKYDKCLYYNGGKGIYAHHISSNPFVEMKIVAGDRILVISTQLIGRYNAENVLAAYCVGLHLGIPDDEISDAVNAYRSHGYRSQMITTERNRIFMDAYNANPSSMLAAINEFLAYPDQGKFVILGEMKEVGARSAEEHRDILSLLRGHGIRDVICVGESFSIPSGETDCLYFGNVDALKDYLQINPLSGRFIFIKGSRSNRLEQILELL
ncbi:MAG: UDP-N-acetylmuramoyl-tripeptide--D-alanyl-D-alanine ligase [Bacteroidales bacterium]|nr:UDP-N-acetylmuramoyl-tripeptide--D-alanyl-D-alanine ligase [Bacteroidales bacterium]